MIRLSVVVVVKVPKMAGGVSSPMVLMTSINNNMNNSNNNSANNSLNSNNDNSVIPARWEMEKQVDNTLTNNKWGSSPSQHVPFHRGTDVPRYSTEEFHEKK